MSERHNLSSLVHKDNNTEFTGIVSPTHLTKDRNHLLRRQQQRGISDSMIEVALTYGNPKFIRGRLTFTLTDRILRRTPYGKFCDMLRGLRVVCTEAPPNPKILTVYWHEKTKRRVRT